MFADVYRPTCEGPQTVLLMRTPYDKKQALTFAYSHPAWYASKGYIVAVQDTRGRFRSCGEFYPFAFEARDGFDSVEWASNLSGSTGRVGMYGCSYVGATQLLAAIAEPPSLACICPAMTASDFFDGWTYHGGAFALEFNLTWAIKLAINSAQRMGDADLVEKLVGARNKPEEAYLKLPLTDLFRDEPALRRLIPYYFDWLDHDQPNAYWRQWSIRSFYERIAVPALHIAGWYDIFLTGTLENFQGLSERAGSALAREGQRLIVAPWSHSTRSRRLGEADFGHDAANDIDRVQIEWFDRWLKVDEGGRSDEPPVRIFLMGENRWRSVARWPIADLVPTPFYFHSRGRANASSGDGRLDTDLPYDEPPDVFIYSPHDPVRSLGGNVYECVPAGPFDQRPIEARNATLVYTSEVLERDVVIGAQ